MTLYVDVTADERQVDEKSGRRRDVPVQSAGTRSSSVEVAQPASSRHHPVTDAAAERASPDVPAKSSQSSKSGLEQQDVHHVRPQKQHRVRRIEQQAFEPGPQGTSTPSPTFDRREAFPEDIPAVPSPAPPPPPLLPPPQTSRSPTGSQPRPFFEPVIVAVPSTNDQFPGQVVRLPFAPAPTFHSRKPDVISDVNEDVAEPLRPAPRTDRYRQRTSRTSSQGTRGHQPVSDEPPRPTVAAQEDSSTDTSSSDSDEGDSTTSGDSGEFLLAKRQRQDKPADRQPTSGFRENPPQGPSLAASRQSRVRLLTFSMHIGCYDKAKVLPEPQGPMIGRR